MKLNVVFNRDEGILTGAKKRKDSLDWSREARGRAAREDEVVNGDLWRRDEAQKVIVPMSPPLRSDTRQ